MTKPRRLTACCGTMWGLLSFAACGIESDAIPSATDIDSDDETPCGDATVAVLTDEQAATYVFCAHPEAGTLVLERLPSAAARSHLDEEPDVLALFDRIHPAGVPVPGWVRESLMAGEKVGREAPYRWTAPAAEIGTLALEGSCADPDTFFDDARDHWVTFTEEFVVAAQPSHQFSCVDEAIFEHESFGHTIHTASLTPVTDDGACAVYGRVLGCGSGDTVLTGDIRGTPGAGAWSNFFTFSIPSGGLGKVKGYANGAHSCNQAHDRDDFRIEADSEPGASHHYAAIFINRALQEWNHCFLWD